MGAEHDHQHECDHEIDCGPRQRHHDFLAGLFGHAFERSNAPDRQQRHIGGADAVAARRNDVAELVQHHAGKERDDKDHAIQGLWGATPRPADGSDPGEQQKERQVDAHGGAADFEELDRPTHG